MTARAESVVPATDVPASWELTGLRHERLSPGAMLRDAMGPLWVLVLDGVMSLETAVGVEPLRTGDAVLLEARTAYRLRGAEAADGALVAVADLRLVVPPSPVPSPLVVRDFSARHHGVHELVRTCPLQAEC